MKRKKGRRGSTHGKKGCRISRRESGKGVLPREVCERRNHDGGMPMTSAMTNRHGGELHGHRQLFENQLGDGLWTAQRLAEVALQHATQPVGYCTPGGQRDVRGESSPR